MYCQVGRTTNCEIHRKSFFDPNEIVDEIIRESKRLPHVNYITFSGSGEPTLNSDIGWMIGEIKKALDTPVAVITNGSLLYVEEVRNDLNTADVVLPSLDAASEDIFRYIDRPHSLIELKTIIEGMKEFRNGYKGKIWLEVMLIKNVNDSTEEVEKLKKISQYLAVDKVQLNTVTRPPIDERAAGVSKAALEKICKYFGHGCEIISSFQKTVKKGKQDDWPGMVLDILSRRSLTLTDIVSITGMPVDKIKEGLGLMETQGKIKSFPSSEDIYYTKKE